MSQKTFGAAEAAQISLDPVNVLENWVLYDTVLIGADAPYMSHHEGYFGTFAALGAAASIPFFNVRNRNHGLAYNDQDKRDSLPYAFSIYSLGVAFFGPSTGTYRALEGSVVGTQRTELDLFESELPRHCSVVLQTNQDERVKLACNMAPPGYGPVTSGTAQGDVETVLSYPGISKMSWTSGVPALTNKWGFKNPLQVPRDANLSVRIELSEYARAMLTAMPGPFAQFFVGSAAYPAFVLKNALCGIQVTLGGIRGVQQRGQLHR